MKGVRELFREREKEKERHRQKAIQEQSEPRSCGWDATHLRPAASSKLPTQRGSEWVCV